MILSSLTTTNDPVLPPSTEYNLLSEKNPNNIKDLLHSNMHHTQRRV